MNQEFGYGKLATSQHPNVPHHLTGLIKQDLTFSIQPRERNPPLISCTLPCLYRALPGTTNGTMSRRCWPVNVNFRFVPLRSQSRARQSAVSAQGLCHLNGHYEDKRWEAQLTLRSVGSMSEVSRRGEKLTDLLDAREVSEPRTSRTRSENHATRPNSQ